MLRLFAALPIREDIADWLTPMQANVSGASWRPRINFHMTLQFFGNVSHDQAIDLDLALADIRAPQMKLKLSGVGFSGTNDPYALWAGVAYDEALADLAQQCARAARRLGLPIEKRKYVPHVTLAYCSGTSREAAMRFTARYEGAESPLFWADRFHLYSSRLGGGPSRYTAEAEYPLGL